jgi:hypothetical protein
MSIGAIIFLADYGALKIYAFDYLTMGLFGW